MVELESEIRRLPNTPQEMKRHFALNEIKAIASLLCSSYKNDEKGFVEVGDNLISKDSIIFDYKIANSASSVFGINIKEAAFSYENLDDDKLAVALDKLKSYAIGLAHDTYYKNKKAEENREIRELYNELIRAHIGGR